MRLTDNFVRSLSCEPGQRTYVDDTVRGLSLTVGARTKTFMLLLRTANGRKRVKLGTFPEISLGKAREKARDLLAANRLAKDEPPRATFLEAFETYQRTHLARVRPGTREEQTRLIRKYFARLNKRNLTDIKSHDIAPIIDGILKPAEQRNAFVAISILLNWCVKRSYLDASPIARLEAPKKMEPRSRVLTLDELAAVWHALPDSDYGRICKLLIITAQRANQWAAVRAEYITGDTVTWPAAAMKSGKAHTIPLTPLARSLLPKDRIGYLFPSTAGTPFSDWHRNKQRLDRASGVTGYVHHTWRHTWATISAEELDTPPHIIDAVLAHAIGNQISRVYNRALYIRPMREALESFEAHILSHLSASASATQRATL